MFLRPFRIIITFAAFAASLACSPLEAAEADHAITDAMTSTDATVIATDHGFEPSRIEVPAGRTVVISFHRSEPATCITAVEWPGTDLRQELPVGAEVRVSLRAEAGHPISFACPMGTYHGIIEAQSRPEGERPGQASQPIDITVDKDGFHPDRIAIAAGSRSHLRFTRISATSCATAVRIPGLGIAATNLPLGVPIDIAITPTAPGTVGFTCPMGMVKGALIIGLPAGVSHAP